MHSSVNTCFSKSPLNQTNIVEIYTALLNYILAKQNHGKFTIHIQDCELDENVSHEIFRIIKDLEWFGIISDGRPLLQSNKLDIYKEKFDALIAGNKAYRCFCNQNNSEQKTNYESKDIYNRTCLNLSSDVIKAKLAANQKFVWRLKVETPVLPQKLNPTSKKLIFTHLTFSDFALTNQNGALDAVFMNFVDNWMSRITHKLINSCDLIQIEQQAHLYDAFLLTKPQFYILPEIVNSNEKPLSANDFGFFIQDLRKYGHKPQSIINILTQQALKSNPDILINEQPISKAISELIKVFRFKQLTPGSKIIFDIQKI
ncbi:MAG: Glutamate-tRNA ligase [candidate division TM6 bacterium GW2011_GWF2_37_49]|nr:MAG: Glutamate-tRNA ligase [candidate division TM6 bacterium GW2011_GWF2_37_49]